MSDLIELISPTLPDRDVVMLRNVATGDEIRTWREYKFNQHFMTPADGFSFTVAAAELNDRERKALRPGAKVQLVLNGKIQATGYIDSVERHADRGHGVEWEIEGRDVLGPVVDSTMDPTIQFKKGVTLHDLLLAVFTPFGLPIIDEDNAANRDAITGQLRGTKTSAKGKTLKGKGLDQLQPHPKEGCMEFASRITERHGLMIWARADGSGIVVGKPNFDQEPIGILQRQEGAPNNILKGGCKINITDQPHLIVADGFSGGSDFGKGRVKAKMFNPAVVVAEQGKKRIDEVLEKYKSAKTVLDDTFAAEWDFIETPFPRILFLHDDESHTQEQIEYFVRREMSHRLKKVLDAKYTIAGHTLESRLGQHSPVAVDTVVRVRDDIGGVDEPLWVLSRTLHKSRAHGTTTDLELIRKYSIVI